MRIKEGIPLEMHENNKTHYTPEPDRRRIRYRDFRDSRTYHINGRMYPSVTAILGVLAKPALVRWAARVEREAAIRTTDELIREYRAAGRFPPSGEEWAAMVERRLTHILAMRREMDAAARVGSEVHARIEWELVGRLGLPAGPEPALSEDARQAYDLWLQWEKSVDLRPIAIEHVVHSEVHRYAGAIDLLAEVNGKITVVDFKTGGGVYIEALLQNAAYRAAVHEMGLSSDLPAGLIARIPRTGAEAPEIVPVEDFDRLFSLFLAVRTVHGLLSEIEVPNGRYSR